MDQRSPSTPFGDILEPEHEERTAVTLGPGIFYKTQKFSRTAL